MEEETSVSAVSCIENCRFVKLRSVRWRVNLGILPSSHYSSIDDLRRVTADSRRRYAALRRRLLVDPQMGEDETNYTDLAVDNPLSDNPDSTWSRFFRNSELEKTVDQDLSRLYPVDESFFHSSACQGLLRRVLLLWCLRHQEIGYRQGMHELLAPLVYVLHADVEHLSEVRKDYGEQFTDRFDTLEFKENGATYTFNFRRSISMEYDSGSKRSSKKLKSLNELDPEIQSIVLMSDTYGAEGELGIVLSEKFMEHDVYCMFDALMSGAHGSVALSDFFSHSPPTESVSGLPPVIEACSAFFHLLRIVDSSLHSHLVELGVEPQYFALRWLRVLFGREFSLQNLLMVWDEIFTAENSKLEKSVETDQDFGFRILTSPRGAIISSMAVSMMLFMRSSLLGTENATSALQMLLNLPENIDLGRIIETAKSLQVLALEINTSLPCLATGDYVHNPSEPKIRSVSFDSTALKPSATVVPESYWEEKWRDMQKAEELKEDRLEKLKPTHKRSWSERVRFRLSRSESDPTPNNVENENTGMIKSFVRRSWLADLSRLLGSEDTAEKPILHENPSEDNIADSNLVNVVSTPCLNQETPSLNLNGQEIPENKLAVYSKDISHMAEESSTDCVPDEEYLGDYKEDDSEESSIVSTLTNDPEETSLDSSVPVSQSTETETQSPETECEDKSRDKSIIVSMDKKPRSGNRFQWLWKFGRNASGEEASDRRGSKGNDANLMDSGNVKMDKACSSADGRVHDASSKSKGGVDQNLMGTLRSLGQSMLEHIKVIEYVFQLDRGVQAGSSENLTKSCLVEKGQITAMAALKELRNISNFLSEI